MPSRWPISWASVWNMMIRCYDNFIWLDFQYWWGKQCHLEAVYGLEGNPIRIIEKSNRRAQGKIRDLGLENRLEPFHRKTITQLIGIKRRLDSGSGSKRPEPFLNRWAGNNFLQTWFRQKNYRTRKPRKVGSIEIWFEPNIRIRIRAPNSMLASDSI